MILTPSNIAHYLLGRGIITHESVVDGDFRVIEKSLRNRNFMVLRDRHPGLFLKQVKSFDQQAIITLGYEATCYRLANEDEDFKALAPLMPQYHAFDADRHVLIVELLKDGENLADYHVRVGRFPTEVADQVGRLLGRFHHDIREKIKDSAKTSLFQKRMPWILQLHQLSSNYLEPISAGNAEVINIVKNFPEFHETLNALQSQYEFNCLIHGDIKWENCVLYRNGGEAPGLKIVDWELADVGDACWDAGAIFQAYITCWIMSIPLTPGVPPSQLMDQAKYPIDDMQPAISTFWRAYAEALGADEKTQRGLLERSVRYGAARMIQTVYEHMTPSPQITPNAVCLLQVSLNILQNPAEAITDLLGM